MTIQTHRFALRSTRVVTPGTCGPAMVIVNGETLESVLPYDAAVTIPTQDLGDLVVMPGLVDTHVHMNDPDGAPRVAWEGFDSATRAAGAGGITTLVDMPLNSTPVTTTRGALEHKQRAFARNGAGSHVDVGFHGGLVHGNASEIPGLLDAGVLGIKAFLVHSGIDDFPAAQESDLRAVMPLLAQRNVPLLAHAEVDHLPPATLPNDDPRSYARYLASRPAQWESAAIDMLLRLANEFHCPTHIVHLASEEPLAAIVAARKAGVPVTVETCPHYLHFCAEEIPDGATQYKCAPPIREAKTREALWNALRSNAIDMIASDHSPCPPSLKQLDTGNFAKAWGGISSLQLGLSIIWTDAARRRVTLNQLAYWMSEFPARLARLGQKGGIVAGRDADFVVFDPDASMRVNARALHHRHPLTPYDGEMLKGKIHQTYLRGTLIYNDGNFPAPGVGKMLLRHDSPHAPP